MWTMCLCVYFSFVCNLLFPKSKIGVITMGFPKYQTLFTKFGDISSCRPFRTSHTDGQINKIGVRKRLRKLFQELCPLVISPFRGHLFRQMRIYLVGMFDQCACHGKGSLKVCIQAFILLRKVTCLKDTQG